MKQTVWHHLKLCPEGDPQHTLADAAIAVENGKIVWLGAASDLPVHYAAWPREDLHGAWVTPGLVDCHTHLVYGGPRADEFAQRLAGVSYEEIARQGGGIVSTVRATRAADEDSLFRQSAARLEPLLTDAIRRRQAADALLAIAERVAEAGIEPMSMEEIDREVKAVRAERRRRAGGR